MTSVLIILSFLALVLNLGAPPLVSDVPAFVLVLQYVLVLIGGNRLINKTLEKSCSAAVKRQYYHLFLIGFIIALLVLHFVWTPGLNPNLENWGFDPQRYYYYATEMARGENIIYGLTFQGVVYFYLGCLLLFGIDPLVPLYVNILLSLYATLLIVRTVSDGYNSKSYKWLILIPEVVCYSFMPSREILCMSGATVFLMKYIEFGYQKKISSILIMVGSFLLVTIIRPPMIIPIVLGIIVHTLMHASVKKIITTLSFGVLLTIGITFGLGVSSSLGSDSDVNSMEDRVSSGFSGKTELRDDAASSGMTVLLLPHNPVEYVVFGVIRSFAYVVPPPLIITDPINQFSLADIAIYPNLTVIAMFFFLPTIWTGLRRLKKLPPHIQLLALVLVLYFLMIGVTLTNLIHQRYRIVYDLFYFAFAIYCWIHRKEWKMKIENNNLTMV